jgi:hypothetical protein
MRIIRTTSWHELAEKHDIPIFNMADLHKIPDGIVCILITGDNGFYHKENRIECRSVGDSKKLPYISDVKFPNSLIFSTNASIWHPNIIPIPIGVMGFDESQIKQDSFGVEKTITCYANFNLWCERRKVKKALERHDFIYWQRYEGENAQEKYIADLCNSNFVISPFGNGMDCYRVWESIYCGAIPIVPRCVLFERFQGLPIIMLDSWDNLTIEKIQQYYDNLKARGGSYDYCDLDYWEKKILSAHKKIKDQ